MMGSYSGIAGGNIAPSRFVVKSESSGEPVITQAGANGDVFGISQPSTRRMALSGWDDGYAAVAGENINVYGDGDDACPLEIAGTISAGGLIKSDGDGKGVAASSDADKVGARAMVGGEAGDIIKVKPIRFDRAS